MKDFNLEKAIAGAPLVTRDGRKVLEFKYFTQAFEGTRYPVFVILEHGGEEVLSYTKQGEFSSGRLSPEDLFMATTERKGYVNVLRAASGFMFCSRIYTSLTQAEEVDYGITKLVKRIEFTYEEE